MIWRNVWNGPPTVRHGVSQSGDNTDPCPNIRIEKVLRGGAWNMPAIFARNAYRDACSRLVEQHYRFRVVTRETPEPPIP